jgi:hypothetical protein
LFLLFSMSLSEDVKQQLRDAILALGYPALSSDLDGALCDVEHALYRVEEGDCAKVVRFELYRGWAQRAGCKCGSRKASARFQVQNTDAYDILKRLVRDEADDTTNVQPVRGTEPSTGLKFL